MNRQEHQHLELIYKMAEVPTLLDFGTLPLADARPAGVGQHSASNLLKHIQQAITLDGGADLLAAWSDGEWHLQTQIIAYVSALPDQACQDHVTQTSPFGPTSSIPARQTYFSGGSAPWDNLRRTNPPQHFQPITQPPSTTSSMLTIRSEPCLPDQLKHTNPSQLLQTCQPTRGTPTTPNQKAISSVLTNQDYLKAVPTHHNSRTRN
jgi:hypothetical protein